MYGEVALKKVALVFGNSKVVRRCVKG
jgi:hypothetical protein